MKKTIVGAMIIIISSCLAAGGQALSKQAGRVLVLGFESRQLNDVQDRLLRETVLYRLHAGGRAIVPGTPKNATRARRQSIALLPPHQIRGGASPL